MARIRTIKPAFFDNPQVAHLTSWARLAFIGLWTEADKEGRLVDDPQRLKARLFSSDLDPQHQSLGMDGLLTELADAGFILRYTAEGRQVIEIVNFQKHQRPHPKEPTSILPGPAGNKDAPAVKRNGEPGKEITGTLDNGLWSTGVLEHGERTSDHGSASALPVSPNQDTEAADFVRWYQQQYATFRLGAAYPLKPAIDYMHAQWCVAHYPDREWLRMMAEIFLQTDHRDAERGSRTIGQFTAMAGWCDQRLREAGHRPKVQVIA